MSRRLGRRLRILNQFKIQVRLSMILLRQSRRKQLTSLTRNSLKVLKDNNLVKRLKISTRLLNSMLLRLRMVSILTTRPLKSSRMRPTISKRNLKHSRSLTGLKTTKQPSTTSARLGRLPAPNSSLKNLSSPRKERSCKSPSRISVTPLRRTCMSQTFQRNGSRVRHSIFSENSMPLFKEVSELNHITYHSDFIQ